MAPPSPSPLRLAPYALLIAGLALVAVPPRARAQQGAPPAPPAAPTAPPSPEAEGEAPPAPSPAETGSPPKATAPSSSLPSPTQTPRTVPNPPAASAAPPSGPWSPPLVLALLLSGGSLLLAGAGWIQVLGWPRWVPGDRGKGKLKQLEHRLEENRRTMKTDFRSLVEARLGEYHKELETKVVSPLRRGQQELSQRLNQSRQKDNETAELWGRISYLESRIASLAHERNQQPAGGSAPSPAENPPEGPMPQQQSEPPPAPPPPADPNLDDAVGALNRSDKAGLRALVKAELNITTTSEEALQKGNVGLPTELCPVSGGGSYLLIERGGRHWLLPTVQTLAGFSSSQPQKGLFDYERDTVMVAELSRAAEVRCSGDTWEVIRRGQVIVPI